MQRVLLCAGLCGALVTAACATGRGGGVENQVSFEEVPSTLGEFVSVRDAMAVHPEGGAACLVLAALMYAQDEALGLQALSAMLDHDPAAADVAKVEEKWSKKAGHDHVPRSYVQGTNPDDGYVLGQPPYVIKVKARDEEKGTAQVLVYTTGADHARPVTLRRNDKGVWQATDWGNLLLNVRPPKTVSH